MIEQIYKQVGETPREALERFRYEYGIAPEVSVTFAGRLDPMAEGWMHVLSGGDVYRKDEFANLDKTYEVEVLWGVATDTYDLLGIPIDINGRRPFADDVREEIVRWETTFTQQYPPFSAKPINGKPLWWWARENRLDEVEIPTKQITIHSIEYERDHTVSTDALLRTVHDRCAVVRQDFRQKEIMEAWQEQLRGWTAQFGVSKLMISCTAGTYVRSVVYELGQTFGMPACAFTIKRNLY